MRDQLFAITTRTHPFDNLNAQSLFVSSQKMHRYVRCCKGIAALPVVFFAGIAVVALRALAWLCKIVGQVSKAQVLKYQAKKFQVLYILHHLDNLIYSPLPVYSHAKNLIKSDVVSQGEDGKTIKNMRDRFLGKHGKRDNTEKLRTMSCQGAQTKGICFGATISVLKTCLENRITTEEQLKNIALRFEEGFDAEAAGLQKIYSKTQVLRVMVCDDIDALQKELNALVETYHAKFAEAEFLPQKEVIQAKINSDINSVNEHYLQKTQKCYIQYYNDILQLMGLEIATTPDKRDQIQFHNLDKDEDAQKRFNNLPEGLYYLSFSEHAVSYLKYSFGSFVLDSGNGLMPFDRLSPSQSLLTLVKSYASQGNYNAIAYRIKKGTSI